MKLVIDSIKSVLLMPWNIFKYLFIEELFRIKEISVFENSWAYKVEFIKLYTPEVYRRLFSFATRIDFFGEKEDRDMISYHGIKDSNYAFRTKKEAEKVINLYKAKTFKSKAIYHEVKLCLKGKIMNDSFHDGELDARYYEIADKYEASKKALKEIRDMACNVLNRASCDTPEHTGKFIVDLVVFVSDVSEICEKELGESK